MKHSFWFCSPWLIASCIFITANFLQAVDPPRGLLVDEQTGLDQALPTFPQATVWRTKDSHGHLVHVQFKRDSDSLALKYLEDRLSAAHVLPQPAMWCSLELVSEPQSQVFHARFADIDLRNYLLDQLDGTEFETPVRFQRTRSGSVDRIFVARWWAMGFWPIPENNFSYYEGMFLQGLGLLSLPIQVVQASQSIMKFWIYCLDDPVLSQNQSLKAFTIQKIEELVDQLQVASADMFHAAQSLTLDDQRVTLDWFGYILKSIFLHQGMFSDRGAWFEAIKIRSDLFRKAPPFSQITASQSERFNDLIVSHAATDVTLELASKLIRDSLLRSFGANARLWPEQVIQRLRCNPLFMTYEQMFE